MACKRITNTKWANFNKVIEIAKIACKISGHLVSDYFADLSKMIILAKGAKREVLDYKLTRYADKMCKKII